VGSFLVKFKFVKKVVLYTDGGCDPNPGPGGYGIVLIFGKRRKELSGGYRLTTNNRMELMAAIKGLEALTEPCNVKLYSDSEYLVQAMNQGWVQRWKARGWRRSSKDLAANVDLWERLLALCQKHQVEFVWIRGHAGNPENERCDRLVMQAMRASELMIDVEYESSVSQGRQPKLI
jgi:ribonuclease HI